MSLTHGHPYLAIPGPSVVPDEVLRAMHRPSPNIYEGELIELTDSLKPDLRRVAGTQHHVAMYIGNGHASWEASLANVVAPGDRVLVPATGRFSYGWAETARGLGIEVEVLDFGQTTPNDPARIEAALRADTDQRIKAVLAVHVDTSTSLRNDLAALRCAMDAAGHPALLIADCMASMGCDRFEMDKYGVDVAVVGSQKGLMVPAGMFFVFLSDRAMHARGKLDRVSPYWDWCPRVNPGLYYEHFCGTAPTHHLFGMRASLDLIKAEGMEAVWQRHETCAKAIWAACDVWGEPGHLRLNVPDPAHRSHAVTSLQLRDKMGTPLRRWTQDQAGVTLGIGLGRSLPDDPDADGFFRFGHMGHVSAAMILSLLGTVEAGLCALDIPHGRGAVDAAAQVIASA